MTTFRQDIHLGRRVPVTGCLLTSISSDGIAVDSLGRKWQLTKYEEGGGGSTETGDKIYYGWGQTDDELANASGSDLLSWAKGSVVKTTDLNVAFSINSGGYFWKAIPTSVGGNAESALVSILQNGQTTTDKGAYDDDINDYQNSAVINGVSYMYYWTSLTGTGTITKITVS